MCVLYMRPPSRRPVRIGLRIGLRDIQGEIPRAWCRSCGAEVFYGGADQCPRCGKEAQSHVYEKLPQSL